MWRRKKLYKKINRLRSDGRPTRNMAMDLTSVRTIKKMCAELGLRPNKRLGQNFLINRQVLDRIIRTADLKKTDTVLEIGPGWGVLTRELVGRAERVVAVEKDQCMAVFLRKEIRNKKLEIRNGDILGFQISDFRFQNYKIVANLPYQITSPVLWRFLREEKNKPTEMVLMVQKEVAERITAKPGQMNLLAVVCQFYARCEIVSRAGRGNFWPVPAVDSALIKLKIKDQRPQIKEDLFFQVVKTGFAGKRKMLKNNLARGLNLEQDEALGALKQAGLDVKVRAQELSIGEWADLARIFEQGNKN